MPCEFDNHGMRTRNNIISLIVLFHKNLLKKKVIKFGKVSAWIPAPKRSNKGTHRLSRWFHFEVQIPSFRAYNFYNDSEIDIKSNHTASVHEKMNPHAQTHRHIHKHRRTGDLGILQFWDFPFEFQVRQQFKSDGKIINQRASEGFREPQIASKGLRGLQRASWGLREPIFFLFFFHFNIFFHFSPTGFESDTILSPTPRDFPGSPGSPFSYADVCVCVCACVCALAYGVFGDLGILGLPLWIPSPTAI